MNLIDVTLVCEDANSKLVEVVTIAAVVEVDDEEHADNGLVQIWKINFGHKVKLLFGLIEILKLMFRQDFEVVLQI